VHNGDSGVICNPRALRLTIGGEQYEGILVNPNLNLELRVYLCLGLGTRKDVSRLL